MTTLTQSTIGQPVSNDLLIQHSQKELLRFITCGSVDDGKSTLIGRLLLETGAVYEDQIAVLQTDSRKHGTTAEEIDPALLLDGLEDERQQGITIDVAYRYFATSQRKFIIADTPGHEQFTRNMATGASTAQLSIVLVDATKGVLTQTRRHTFIVSLLGIQHVIVAVNKMDLVEYDHNVFESIASECRQFAEQLAIPDVRFVPISALKGDNVTSLSPNMPWYDRGSLLQQLENVNVSAEQQLSALRFPVQWVNRSNSQFRGFSGTLSAGSLKVGDQVEILPSRKISRIRRIVTRNEDLAEANASQAITVTLADEIDIARGDMIVHPLHKPLISRQVEATLVWMSEQPLVLDKPYWLKHTTRRTSAEIKQLMYSTDINTLQRSPATTLGLNDIGHCRLTLRDPIMLDSYRENRTTGSFILVDRITHETVAAGMIETPSDEFLGVSRWDAQPMGFSLERVVSRIDIGERERAYGQKPFTLLISGLSASGKTSLAVEVERRLFDSGRKCVLLDGQSMRCGICRDLGFSAEERSENLRRAAEIAKILNDSGLICIAAFVAPHDDIRQRVRELVGAERFFHVHLTTPVEICRQRDTTMRYAAADSGELANFPGVTFPYEAPQEADLELSTTNATAQALADTIIELLRQRFDGSCVA